MHLPLRRNTKRTGSPPKAAPSPPETFAPNGTFDSLPHEMQSVVESTSPQSSPQKKGVGRRMASFSKPVRMLKSMASRGSLRNPGPGHGHGRIASAASVQTTESQHEADHEHEASVKEERESVDTDYGREVTRQSQYLGESVLEPVGEQDKGPEGEHPAVQTAVHEAPARQEPAKEQAEEKETRVKQAANTQEEQAARVVAPVIAHAGSDAKNIEDVGTASEATREPKEAISGDKTITASKHAPEVPVLVPLTESVTESMVLVNPEHETNSLASSSTTANPVPHPAPLVNPIHASVDVKEVKMLPQPHQSPDVNPLFVEESQGSLPGSQKEVSSSPVSAAASPATQSVVLSKEISVTGSATQPPEEKKVVASPPPQKPSSTSPENSTSPLSSSSEEAPELHAPALTVTSLFLPVPHTDPLSTLLTKYVPEPHLRPPRDTTGEWQHADFHTLVMTNNWRALARMARDRILTANPRDVELVLNLWYIRLSSLAHLRLFNQASAECENLFNALATIEPPTARAYILRNILPFELEVLRARCAYWSGDHLGYLDDVSALLHQCRIRARQARDVAEQGMWKERGARMALIVASQLVEMKDYTAAATLLEPLSSSGASPPSPALRSAIARIYLQGGNLSAAEEHFDAVDADSEAEPALKTMNAVIRSAALGDWVAAAEYARGLAESEPADVVAANNYAVALLGQGRIKEGIQVLEATLQASPSAATTTEPYLFNLSTMYELRAGLTAHRKRDLLIEVAKWSGDGLRTACLKMSA